MDEKELVEWLRVNGWANSRSQLKQAADCIERLTEVNVPWQSGWNPPEGWKGICCAGWPQLPYAELKKLPRLPDTPAEELRKIRDPQLRKDALKMRRELDEVLAKQLEAQEIE